ncbi:MAG: NAD(P)/FAD-dependent oxidoreductase [Aquabacterium sp.]|nr:NAD(P)/FAD-dependent oxidoreductase [Ferruginibacter sp.]
MLKPDLKPFYDIAIIGAGVGGLTAAALLSKAGFSVCVLEKEPHVGGYLAGFRRKDFIFDTAIHWLNQCNPDGMVSRLFDVLGADHPNAVPQKRIRRYQGDGFNYLLTNNPDEWRDQLIAEFPADRQGILRFFKAAKRLGKSFKNYSRVFRSEETMNFFERLLNKKKLLEFVIPFIPFITYSGEKGLAKGLKKYFRDESLHKIFASETELLSCLVPIGWAYFGDFQSPPKGGGQIIPEWLEYVIKFYKNTVNCQCRVTQILLQNNTVTGVAFQHRGHDYTIGCKYVIAANDVETLYEKMLPENAIPAKLKNKLKQAEMYSSSVTISIALDCPAEQLGFNEELVHIASETGSFQDHSGGDPLKSEISILAPSLRDPSMAPPGQGTLTLFMPAYMNFSDNWHTQKDEQGNYIRGEAYKKLKNEIAELIIGRVEAKCAPGLRSHILFYEVATPITHHRYTGNKNGTMMGAKPGRENMQNKIAHYQTPVKNLLLGGHWAELGGGVPIAVKAGTNASLLILKKENNVAFKQLAAYLDNKVSLEMLQRNPCFKPYDNSWVQPLTPAQKRSAMAGEKK